MKYTVGYVWSNEQMRLEVMFTSHSELPGQCASQERVVAEKSPPPARKVASELNLPQNWRKHWTSHELHVLLLLGRWLFKPTPLAMNPRLIGAEFFAHPLYLIGRKANKEDGILLLKGIPCLQQCLGPIPLSVGWWKEWEAEPWAYNLPQYSSLFNPYHVT